MNQVTVVIPVYNGSEWIIQTLSTLKSQSYTNWNCLVINDGSTDNSLELINEYIDSHPQLDIKVVTSENLGPSSARNAGISRAAGDFIAFLDQDDLWSKKKIETQLQFLEDNPSYLGVLCDFAISKLNQKSELVVRRVIRNSNISKLSRGWISLEGNGAFLSSSFLFRRTDLTQKILFNPIYSHVADLDYFLRFNSQCNIGYLSENLVTYIQHASQMHRNSEGLKRDYPNLLHEIDIEQYGISLSRAMGNFYAMCMLIDFRNRMLRESIQDFVDSFKQNRFSCFIIIFSVLRKRIASVYLALVQGSPKF